MTNDFPIERVLLAAEEISGNRDRVVAWLREPLITFDGKIALELIVEGRSEIVLRSWPRSPTASSVESAAHDEHVTSVSANKI